LEKYALTKPLPPTKERSMENFADAEGRRNQSAEGRKMERLISRLSKTRKLSRAV
jgi:hypothetical protein